MVVTFVRRTDSDVSFINQCIETDKSWIMDIGRLVTTGSDQRPGELWFRPDLIGWGPWFNGTYRLIELSGDFRYAMLGDPDGSKLWILSRTRQMDEQTYQRLVARAAERGLRHLEADPHGAERPVARLACPSESAPRGAFSFAPGTATYSGRRGITQR